MNFSRGLLWAFLLLACLGTAGLAQQPQKFRLSSLPEKATIAETQEWLIAALTQNSSYASKNSQQVQDMGAISSSKEAVYTDSKISEVKFNGSLLTYKINRAMQINSGGTKGVQTGSNSPPIPQETNATVQLDLKDINPEEITLQDIDETAKIQQLSLRTYDFKRTIKLKSPDTGTVTVSVANFVIGGNIGEQVQTAFVHLVKLVQGQNP